MIRLAAAADVPALKALWMEAFGDTPEGTDHYFTNRFQPDGMLVLEEQDELQGMLSMLPIDLVLGARRRPARYLFAIATAVKHRGKGVSSRLITHALELVRATGDAAAMLVPAGEDLFRFYGKRGFDTRFFVRLQGFTPDELPPSPQGALVSPLSAADMLRLRDAAFGHSGLYARWGQDALDYVKSSADVFCAVLVRLQAPDADGYAYGEWDGGTLVVKELAAIGMSAPQALAVLHRHAQAKHYTVRLQDAADTQGERVPFGMWVPFDDSLPRDGGGWLGLAKD